MNEQKGQTIIEVLVSLMIASLMMGALVIAIVISLRNAQFSQNQTQATKLAQEAIEKVRTMRDRDMCIKLTDTGDCTTFSNAQTFSQFLGNDTQCSAVCYFDLDKNNLLLTLKGASSSTDLGGGFTQQILVQTSGTFTKRFIAKIQWNDSSGFHESNLQTFLTRL